MLSFAAPDKAFILWLAETPLSDFRMLKNCSWDKYGLIAVERVKSFLSSKMNFKQYVSYCFTHTTLFCFYNLVVFKKSIAIMKG